MPETANEPSFAEQVNEAVKQLSQDDKGTWQFPETFEASPEVKFAATLEKRRRDTESALGTTRHQLKTERAIRQKLEQRVTERVQVNLTAEQSEALEALREDDPETWRQEMNRLEKEARTQLTSELSEDVSSVSQLTEQERREAVLKTFNDEHPDAPLTDDMLEGDIPPRIVKKLEKGQISFEEFLQESYDFLTAAKVIKTDKPPKAPSLGRVGGGSDPASEAVDRQEVTDYKHTVF